MASGPGRASDEVVAFHRIRWSGSRGTGGRIAVESLVAFPWNRWSPCSGFRTHGARVVSVSSAGHRFSPVMFDDINFERRAYDPFKAYGQSKTANILFAVALDRRGKDVGIRAFALHPGGIAGTNLGTHVGLEMLKKTGFVDENDRPVVDLSRDLKSVPQGAATHVWCAVSPQLDGKGGVFCADSDITPVLPEGGSPDLTEDRVNRGTGVEAYAVDPDAAEELWRRSEEITRTSIQS